MTAPTWEGYAVIAPDCVHAWKKNGVDKNGTPRLRCKLCGQSVLDRAPQPLGSLRVDLDKAAQAISMLCEGMGVRAVSRLTGLDKGTILRIVVEAGESIERFSARTITNMEVAEVECDEIWAFCYCKKKTQHAKDWGFKVGDIYTYAAIDRNTKLYLTYAHGKRYTETGAYFMQKLKACTKGAFQLSTDGWNAFEGLVDLMWRGNIDYAQVVKTFVGPTGGAAAVRYSPGKIRKVKKRACSGSPNLDRAGTSIAERGNLGLRMGNRRMTRLTNSFSRKWENHEAMMALYIGVHNFCKVHGTLKTTPAVAAGLTDHNWSVRELLEAAAS
jgi:transposase-like protein/IS1 family transposase